MRHSRIIDRMSGGARSEGGSAVFGEKAAHGLFAGASQGVESESVARRQMNMIGATPTRATLSPVNRVSSRPTFFECRTADSLSQAQGLRGCKCRTLVAIAARRNRSNNAKHAKGDARLHGALDESCAKVGFPLPPFLIHDVHHVHRSRPKLHSTPPSAGRFSRALQRVAPSIRSERTCTRGNVRHSSYKLIPVMWQTGVVTICQRSRCPH